ncbi:unnamed protein product [Gulo gulo]|uniref:Uncharacterized protein n=1 Tax=Gulo gulo TaxID=48420 RepID=A0A9X9Q2Q5_GULGU|nr:unnamed protein product [Gulo gulo]
MVSRYLVNQQTQYLGQSHNHQTVRSDSHIRPAGFSSGGEQPHT